MSGLVNSLSSWWSSLSVREQRLLSAGGILLLVAAVFWGLIQPVADRAEKAQTKINSEKQLLNWVSNKADEIIQLRGSSGRSVSERPMNQVVSGSVSRFNIELIRMQPREDMLQVWIKPVAFNQFISWLNFLNQDQGIRVEYMDISQADSKGVVEIKRLQLKRGS